MSLSKLLTKKQPQETHENSEALEVEKLKKLINGPLVKIQSLQTELQELEKELNHFFDSYYGSEKHEEHSHPAIKAVEELKNNIMQKIAKLCAKDSLGLKNETSPDVLLKLEGYLNEGSEKANSPQEQLSNLAVEYYNIIKHTSEEKLKKPIHELKQAAVWVNVKTTETISKIKEEITNRINHTH